jgi:hypothetical protein
MRQEEVSVSLIAQVGDFFSSSLCRADGVGGRISSV